MAAGPPPAVAVDWAYETGQILRAWIQQYSAGSNLSDLVQAFRLGLFGRPNDIRPPAVIEPELVVAPLPRRDSSDSEE